MPLEPARAEHISRIARSLWLDFYGFKGPSFRPASIFEADVSKDAFGTLKQFYKFCASIYSDDDASVDVEAHVINDTMPYTKSGNDTEAASWLLSIKSMGNNCPCVIINLELLNSALSIEGAIRTKHHLLLHEVGHLVLHWNELRTQVSPDGSAVAEKAHPIHEAEAWWFCYSFLGTVVAHVAFENKKNKSFADDQIWKLPLR